MVRALLGVCLGVTLNGCSSSKSGGRSPAQAAKQVGPEGGEIKMPDGSRIDVPAGALAAAANLTIATEPSAPTLSSDWTAVGAFYVLSPEGEQFLTPVTVTLTFDPSRLPPNATIDDVAIATSPVGGTPSFTALPTSVVDATHVAAHATHFSVWVPVGIPTKPCGDGRIPAKDTVCCGDGTSSYCTNRAGVLGTNGVACLANTTGMCTGDNPFASARRIAARQVDHKAATTVPRGSTIAASTVRAAPARLLVLRRPRTTMAATRKGSPEAQTEHPTAETQLRASSTEIRPVDRAATE